MPHLFDPDRPLRKRVISRKTPNHLRKWIVSIGKTLWWLFLHTISPFDRQSTTAADTCAKFPVEGGEFGPDISNALQIHIYDSEEDRRRTLEDKASNLLNIILAFAPLLVGVATAAIGLTKSAGWAIGLACILFGIALLSLLIALTAGLRAVRVKEKHALWLGAFINEKRTQFRGFSNERYVRGLVWCGIMNAGLNNHLADYVRAAQYYLILSVLATMLGLGLVFPRILDGSNQLKPVGVSQPDSCNAHDHQSFTQQEDIDTILAKTPDLPLIGPPYPPNDTTSNRP